MFASRSRRSSRGRPSLFFPWTTAGRRSRSLSRQRPQPAPGCERLEPRAVLAAAAPAAPPVSLVQDTGASATDRVTNIPTLAVTTVGSAAVEYSVNGGKAWSPTFVPQSGVNKLLVRQTEPGGTPSKATSFSFTYDDTPPAPLAVSLKSDTGVSSTDRQTRDGTLSFVSPATKKTTLETAATAQYWNSIKLGWESSFLPVEGLNTVKVRQVDKAGNVSPESTLEFTLDTTLPVAPAVSLANDTNIPDDGITSDGTLLAATTGPNAVEATAALQYSTTGGKTWAGSFAPKAGSNSVLVRQVDVAGNNSPATTIKFTFDATAPAAPQVVLAADTGTSKTDRTTANGGLSFVNPTTKKATVETGSTVEYSVLQQNGVTWSDWSASFVPVEGANSVKVRQTDKAGNQSPASTPLVFTLVQQAPTITAVTAPAAKTYAFGQVLEFTVSYSRPVTVSPLSGATAVPYLDLTIGNASRRATYAAGSGTATLVFRATVASGDYGGVSVGGTVGLPTNAFVRDVAGNNGPPTFTAPDTTAVLIDALVPVASISFDPGTSSATMVFTRPVTGVDVRDFRIRGSAGGKKFDLPLTDPLVLNEIGDATVSGSGAEWTLSVQSLPSGNGAFTLVLVAAGSGIVDAVGNPLARDVSVSVTR
jgi:hypothetical protein